MEGFKKKYKEALEQAKFYYNNKPLEPEKKMLEKMFPELAECLLKYPRTNVELLEATE